MSIVLKDRKIIQRKNYTGPPKILLVFLKVRTESIFTLKYVVEQIKRQKVCHEIILVQDENEVEEYFQDFKKSFNNLTLFLINFGENFKFQNFLEKILESVFCVYVLNSYINFSTILSFSEKILIIGENFFSSSFLKTSPKKDKKINLKINLKKLIPKKLGLLTFFNKLDTLNYSNIIWLEGVKLANLLFYKRIGKKRYMDKMIFLKNKFLELHIIDKKKKNIEVKKNFFFFGKELVFNEKENPLDLLKHWTLLESFVNSPLFAIKMRIWKKEGIKTLSGLFFRIGVPLNQIHKKWKNLEKVFKRNFQINFALECKNLGIDFEAVSSFVNFYEDEKKVLNFNKLEISTFDFNLAINSIFDIKLKDLKSNEIKRNFWKAYDAISDQAKIKFGITKTKNARKFVTKIAGFILDKKTFISEEFFRYVHLRENKKMTLNMLKELILFLNGAFLETGFKRKTITLLIHGENLVFSLLYLKDPKNKNSILNQINLMKKETSACLVVEDDPFFGFQIQKQSINSFLNNLRKGKINYTHSKF